MPSKGSSPARSVLRRSSSEKIELREHDSIEGPLRCLLSRISASLMANPHIEDAAEHANGGRFRAINFVDHVCP